MEYYYNIAGLNVQMESFGRTVKQAEAYRIERPERIDIKIESEWPEKKWRHPGMSASDGEYLASGWDFSKKLLDFDGFRLHASAVVVNNKAYLFAADPGTGKSTHTKLWLDHFGKQAYILNDDKPALRLEDGKWYAYGTPWSGKHDISVNARVPLGGIAMLGRSEFNEIMPLHGKELVHRLIKQVNRPEEMKYRIKLLELLDLLVQQVPIWKLDCNMSPEAARVAYEAMSIIIKN